jgi:hypothetical protein
MKCKESNLSMPFRRGSRKVEGTMFTGTLIDDLIAAVERAEQHSHLMEILRPEVREYFGMEASKDSQKSLVGAA